MKKRLKTNISSLKQHLCAGGVVAYPTESCYGLGALPDCPRGVRAVLRLKKRPQHKGMIVIGGRIAQILPLLARLPESEIRAVSAQWPAAKTFLLPVRRHVLPLVRGRRRDKLAVRVPDHETARTLCLRLHTPLLSTSCNRAGGRPCRSEGEVRRLFGRKVRIVGGRTGQRRQPSQIIDWCSQTRLR